MIIPGCRFRPMLEEDIDSVLRVERASHIVAWTPGNFRDCIRAGYTCLLLSVQQRLAGHGIMSVAAGEAQILNLCIHPHYQRQRLGQRLLERLLNIAAQKGADTAFLEVRASNQRALRLYERNGFNEIGTRKAYYPGPGAREDAILLALSLLTGP